MEPPIVLRKRTKRQKKNAQGYDSAPPACANCKHYQRAETVIVASEKRYTPPMCGYGAFVVKPRGVCDVWAGTDGSVLEAIRGE